MINTIDEKNDVGNRLNNLEIIKSRSSDQQKLIKCSMCNAKKTDIN